MKQLISMKQVQIYITALALIAFTSCGKKMEETKAIKKEITETVFASGLLEADNVYNLTAEADGYIQQINFEEGTEIKKGQVLLKIENKSSAVNVENANELFDIATKNAANNAPLFKQAEANITIAKQKLQQDALQVERYKKLWEQNSIAKIEYENVLLTYNNSKEQLNASVENLNKLKRDANQQVVVQKAQKKNNAIYASKNLTRAQTSGKVYKKLKQVGDFVRTGETIAVIGNSKNIYAKINVDESNIAKLKIGQKAIVQLNTQKETNYNAEIFEILPQYDEASKSYLCKLKFTDGLAFSIINTPLQSNIIIGTPEQAILIPKRFLDYNNEVQVKGKKGKTKVTTKIISSEWVQVKSGITLNDILVTELKNPKGSSEGQPTIQ
jgi:HlyD family secretion protein